MIRLVIIIRSSKNRANTSKLSAMITCVFLCGFITKYAIDQILSYLNKHGVIVVEISRGDMNICYTVACITSVVCNIRTEHILVELCEDTYHITCVDFSDILSCLEESSLNSIDAAICIEDMIDEELIIRYYPTKIGTNI